MKGCPECGKLYPDEFLYCPVHGTSLTADPESGGNKPPKQIPVRTVVIGLLLLVVFAASGFTAAFLYQYFKPKYGALTITTTPDEALVYMDGKAVGASPLNIPKLAGGGHEIRIAKEGYSDLVQRIRVTPYAEETKHLTLSPVVPRLSDEQIAEIAELSEKLKLAQKENIFFPPPDDYNVLYLTEKILAIDPADSTAAAAREQVAGLLRQQAELAYARENWAESAKRYESLARIYPDDESIAAVLTDIAERRASNAKDRAALIETLRVRAEAAMKVGSLTPPDKDNAYDAIKKIQSYDKNNAYVRSAFSRLRDQLQDRGDAKITAQDWAGAHGEFQRLLLYFPEDKYSKTRVTELNAKLDEAAKREQAAKMEQLSRRKTAAIRQSALDLFNDGEYAKSIAEWHEYLKVEAESDEAWFYIGAGYLNEKHFDQAIANFRKCLELNPGHVLAHLNIGLVYDHNKNFKAAEEHFVRAKELGGADVFPPERIDETLRDLRARARVDEMSKQAIYVEHKHTFSSCRGALYFGGEAMEFRTSETDHSFYEAYKGMREFNIEGSNLTLRTSMNRKYTFRFLNSRDIEQVRAWWAEIRNKK